MRRLLIGLGFVLQATGAVAASRYRCLSATTNWDAALSWSADSGHTDACAAAVPTASDNCFFDANSGTGLTVLNVAATCLDLNFTGFTGGISSGASLTISGSLTMGAGMSGSTYTGPVTFNATSSKTITSNGKTFASAITFNGAAGTWTLQDAFVTSSSITVTQGTFDANVSTVTAGSVTSAGALTRVINMGTQTWLLTGSGTIWNTPTASGGLTVNASTSRIKANESTSAVKTLILGPRTFNDIELAGSGTGTFSVTMGGSPFTTMNDLFVTCTGAATVTFPGTNGVTMRNLDFTGFTTGTWSSSSTTITALSGYMLLATGMVNNNTAGITFTAASGTKNITSNSVALASALVFNGAGGWQLQDNLTNTSTATLTAGTLDLNGKTMSVTTFSTSNSNTRALTLGTGTLTATSSGTPFGLATTTGMVLSAASGTIKFTDATSSSKTFAGGGLTYGTVQFSGAGSGTFIVTGNNTITTLTVDTPPHTVQLPANGTQTLTTLTASGTAGNLVTFQSSSSGTKWTITKASGTASVNYVSLQDSAATGGARWNAGCNSTSVSGNQGWVFCDINPSPNAVGFGGL